MPAGRFSIGNAWLEEAVAIWRHSWQTVADDEIEMPNNCHINR